MLDVFIAGNKQLAVLLLSDFSVKDILQVASVSRLMRRTWYEGPDALWHTMYPILYTRIYKRPPLQMPDKGSLVRLVAQLNRECWRWRNKDFHFPMGLKMIETQPSPEFLE